MTGGPLVSVCIPTYNSERFIGEAIDSVLSQAFADLELVVVDDASTDATAAVCARYPDRRLRYARFEQNVGQARNFNRCLAEARGQFLTLLHADDYFLPGFVADRVARLKAHPEASFVFGAVRTVNAAGAALGESGRWAEDRVLSAPETLEALLDACVVSPPSLMARRSAALAAGDFRTDLTWGHDWDWSIRLAETGPALYHAAPLAAYRVHDGSGTAEMLRAARNGEQERRILEEAIARLAARDRRYAELRRGSLRSLSRRHMFYAETALLDGRNDVARYNLRFAARANAAMAWRPTFWALLLGTWLGAPSYRRLRELRGVFRARA